MTKLTISPKEVPADVVVDDDGADGHTSAAEVVVVESDEDDGTSKKPELPEAAKLNDDGTVTLTLSKTVTLTVEKKDKRQRSEEVYTTLTFHELTGLDRRLVSQEPTEKQEVLFVARSVKITALRMAAIWDRLAMRDIKRIEKVLTFLSE